MLLSILHNMGPSIAPPPPSVDLWHTVHVLSCSPPRSGSGRRPRMELRAFVSSHIHLSLHGRRSKRGGLGWAGVGGVGFPRFCISALTNMCVRAGRPRAQTFVNQMFTCRCWRDRRGEPSLARPPVCLPFRLYPLARHRVRLERFLSLHLVLSRHLAVLKQPALSCSRAQLPRGSAQVCRWRSSAA